MYQNFRHLDKKSDACGNAGRTFRVQVSAARGGGSLRRAYRVFHVYDLQRERDQRSLYTNQGRIFIIKSDTQ